MVWYNPLGWFARRQEVRQRLLFCDNPQCKSVIKGGQVAYDEEHREIYHVWGCGIIATANKVFDSGEPEVQNIEYISIGEALNLLRKGKLEQSKRLEEMARKN